MGQLGGLNPRSSAKTVTGMKLALGRAIRALRTRANLRQADLAKRLGSTQARVSTLENHEEEVSVELLLRAIFAARPAARREFAALIEKWAGR